MQNIRPAAVAGMFYPAEPGQLAHDVLQLLAQARTNTSRPNVLTPKALIVPHAGYIYSGAIAATAYATLLSPDRMEENQSAPEGLSGGSSRNRLASPVTCHNRPIAARIRRVVLLGPTHRVAVRGLALPGADAFDTPLGRVMLDTAAASAIARLPQVTVSAQAHALEHSLEVQLPFLQSVLTDFTLLPLAVGMATAEEVAEVLDALWGGDETLIVISSDLSHYLPYATAQLVDNETAQSILKLQQPIAHDHACGGTPVSGLIVAARHHHLVSHLLDLRNSGDTAGTRDQVVGYASFVFTEEESNHD